MTHQSQAMPALVKSATVLDEATGDYYDEFTGTSLQGELISVLASRADVSVPQVEKLLLKRGFQLPGGAQRKSVIAAAMAMSAPIATMAAQVGLREGGAVFVLHKRVVAAPHVKTTLLPPATHARSLTHHLKKAGTLDDFNNKIVSIACHSSALVLGIAAGFAAPLLSLLHRPSFALVLVGRSRCGKSSTQLETASMVGFQNENQLPSLNTSPAGLLNLARDFNDHAIVINEIGTAGLRKEDTYSVLRNFTYQLINGRDKIRHQSFEGDGGSASATFSAIFLFSSELGPDEWAARAGEKRDRGEMSRLIGVPVLFGSAKSIFDMPPEKVRDEQTAWERRQFRRLRKRIARYHGAAFETFVEHLVREGPSILPRINGFMLDFEARVADFSSLDPTKREIVTAFAVMYAAGAEATDAGLLNLSSAVVRDALSRCCHAALDNVPDPDKALHAGLRRLTEMISSKRVLLSTSRRTRKASACRRALGIRIPERKGERVVLKGSAVIDHLRNPLELADVLDYCHKQGYLITKNLRAKKKGIGWAERQILWPDGSRPRSIEFFFPRGLADLDTPKSDR